MSEPASDPTGGPKDRSAAPPDPAAAGPGRAHLPVPRAGRLPRNVVVLGLVSFFQDAASELVYPVLPLFLTSTLGASAATVGIVEGVAEGVAACVKVVSGRLAEVRRRRPFVAAGYGIASLAKLLLAAANGWPLVWPRGCWTASARACAPPPATH